MVLREDCVAELNNYIDPLYRSGFVGSHVFKQENLDGKLLTCILEVDGFTQPSVSEARPQVVPTNLDCRWFKFGTMHAGTVTYNITQYSGVRKLETVTVAEVNAYVLNSPLRRFTDPKGSAGQETQQERPEELSFLHGALSLNHSIVTPSA
ncbi:hypothetical protein F2Q69_00008646 [Brassica cretica]|uniref:Uncharacterized protein n=1 Tax=Brassica cretica TaxID=69181 RepID=A0A8S9NVZ6_BRACR|nr:hypothetical protein F2Q69_00008646 [Brassica cretica]